MTNRILHRSIPLTLLLGAFLAAGCDDSEETSSAEATAAEATTTEGAPAATPEPAGPAGWEALEVQVQGHAFTTIAPVEEQRVEESDWGTAVYGVLPGQTYPYYFSLEHHDSAPALRMILNKPGLTKEDTDYGYRAELREEDGNGWSYVVYNDSQKVSCQVSLSASNGVSDALIEEARRPCDRLAE